MQFGSDGNMAALNTIPKTAIPFMISQMTPEVRKSLSWKLGDMIKVCTYDDNLCDKT